MLEKFKYQFSYFLFPYIYDIGYREYLEKIIAYDGSEIRKFDEVKDLEIYSFFKEDILNNIFYNIDTDSDSYENINENNNYSNDNGDEKNSGNDKELLEYLFKKDVAVFKIDFSKGLEKEEKKKRNNSISFNYDGAELFVFKTGVAVIVIKTAITDTNEVSDVLDFNYIFKTLLSEENNIKKLDNILLSMNEGYSIYDLRKSILNIIYEGTKKIEEDDESLIGSFYTHSYMCLDNIAWNENTSDEEISKLMYKYMRVQRSEYDTDAVMTNNMITKVLDELKYSKVAVSKISSVLITAGVDLYNYTKLPRRFETQMLYTYVIALFQKKYLEKLSNDISEGSISDTHNMIKEFNNKFWYPEITLSEKGTKYYNALKEVLEIDKLYDGLIRKYNVTYNYENIADFKKRDEYKNIIIIVLMILNIIFLLL